LAPTLDALKRFHLRCWLRQREGTGGGEARRGARSARLRVSHVPYLSQTRAVSESDTCLISLVMISQNSFGPTLPCSLAPPPRDPRGRVSRHATSHVSHVTCRVSSHKGSHSASHVLCHVIRHHNGHVTRHVSLHPSRDLHFRQLRARSAGGRHACAAFGSWLAVGPTRIGPTRIGPTRIEPTRTRSAARACCARVSGLGIAYGRRRLPVIHPGGCP
jgi:hypothetical protein